MTKIDNDRDFVHKILMLQKKYMEKNGKAMKLMRINWDKVGISGYTVEWRYEDELKNPKK